MHAVLGELLHRHHHAVVTRHRFGLHHVGQLLQREPPQPVLFHEADRVDEEVRRAVPDRVEEALRGRGVDLGEADVAVSLPVQHPSQLQVRGAVCEVDDVLCRQFVRVDHAQPIESHLERGPEGAEPATQLGLVLHRGGVHPGLDGFLDEVRDGLGREVGFVLDLGLRHAADGRTGDPGLLGVGVGLRPVEDFLDQRLVLLVGQQLLDAQVRPDLVEHHRQLVPRTDVVGNEERVALAGDVALGSPRLAGVEDTALDQLVGGLHHGDLAVARGGGDVVDRGADGLDRGAFGVGGAGEAVAVTQSRRSGVDRVGYFFSGSGFLPSTFCARALRSLNGKARNSLSNLRVSSTRCWLGGLCVGI